MTSFNDEMKDAQGALEGLVRLIAGVSANAACNLGVDFDVEDPRVARWLMITTFDSIFMPKSRSKSSDLPEISTAAASEKNATHITPVLRKRRRKPAKQLVTWDLIVASGTLGVEANR